MIIDSTKIEVGDAVYFVKNDIGTEAAIQWIRDYWKEPPSDTPIKEVKRWTLKTIAQGYEDAAFLIRHTVTDEHGRPKAVPLKHVPRLIKAMRESLHIDEFIDTMTEMIGENTEPADGGSEKNLPTG